MGKCRVIFADTELSFLEPIELLVLREYAGEISLELITDPEYLMRTFREPQRVDVLVIHERLWREEFRRQDIRQVFVLCEDAHTGGRTENGDIFLYKYTSAHDVFASINVVLRRQIGARAAHRGEVIAVYSPQGGSGKSTIAAGICAALTSIGCRALFVETDPLQCSGGLLPEDRFASDALLRRMLAGDVDAQTLRDNIGTEAFDFVLPMQYAMAGYGLTEAHCAAVIRTAAGQLGYDYVVADCSSDFNEAKSVLMREADYVVLPFVPNTNGVSKYRRFVRCVNAADREKFLFVRSMDDGALPPDEALPLPLRMVPGLQEAEGPRQAAELLARSGAFTELIYRFL